MASLLGIGLAGLGLLWFTNTEEVPPPSVANDLAVPSGQEVRFFEVIHSAPGTGGLTVRFRFVAPAIARDGGAVSAESAQADMEWLCTNYALNRLPSTGPVPSQIVISLSDREVEFGAKMPEATQFFEAFSVQDGACIWEPF